MAQLSITRHQTLKNSFDLPPPRYLADAALGGRPVTYNEVAGKFGGIAQGQGNKLGGIAIRCHDAGYPLLAIIVVNAQTGRPSVDAVFYAGLGLEAEDAIKAEMDRVYAFDRRTTPLGSGSPGSRG